MYDIVNILVNILETIIGGLLFTLILFFLNEFVSPKKNLTGEWKTSIKVEKTSYKPFKDLKIEFKFHLIQKGNELAGSGEKIKDIKADGTQTVFLREDRVNIDIDGFFERKYFNKSKVYLNIQEEGKKRHTRVTYILTLKDRDTLEGILISTAADTRGTIIMKRQ